MKNPFVLVSLFTLLSISLFAGSKYKSGYYISSKGDTVRGYLLPQSSTNAATKCIYKAKLKNDAKSFGPDEISGYRFDDGKFYISKKIVLGADSNLRIKFMEYLIQGIASMYYLVDNMGEHYFIEKYPYGLIELSEPVRIIEGHIVPTKYRGKLKAVMSDCPDLDEEINNAELNYSSLVSLAKDYHTRVCTSYNCTIFEREVIPVKVKYGINFGLSGNQYTFGTYLKSNYGLGYHLGFTFHLNNTFFSNDKIGISSGAIFSYDSRFTMTAVQNDVNTHFSYNGEDYTMNSEPPIYHNSISEFPVELKVVSISIPVMFDYRFEFKNFALNTGIGLSDKMNITQNKQFRILEFEKQYERTIPQLLIGAIGKVGFERNLSKQNSLSINFSYEYFVDPRGLNYFLRLTESRFSFILEYRF